MKLYLHCGYHKTGSSFLQTLFSRNRPFLQEQGIHFPVAPREYDLQSGNISPGNGPELADALKRNDREVAGELISGYVTKARKYGCESVLLSSENFFHAFENQQALECLRDSTKENGIKEIHAMLYFRDPVNHALSTFKHRAKNGNISQYPDWLKDGYETMGLIERFLEYRNRFPIQWTLRKYSADSEHMADSAFRDWLGVRTPKIPDDDRVNTSLTLSELLAIQSLKKYKPAYIPFVRDAFSNTPSSKKAGDQDLTSKYNAIASDNLIFYKSVIDEVNGLLPEDEKLILMPSADTADHSSGDQLTLTKEQVTAFAKAIEAGAHSGRLLNKARDILLKVVQKVNRKLKVYTA